MQKTKKPMTKKQIMSLIGTVLVCLFLAALTLYAFLGRSDNTRTHFDTVKGEKYFTDGVFADTNEYLTFEFNIMDSSLTFNDAFKAAYPVISETLLDLDFCASETDVKSVSFDEGLLVMDTYSYTADYSVRYMDMLYIPHKPDDARNIVIGTPLRHTIKYDSKLAIVELQPLDIENYRLSFYDLTLNVSIGNEAKQWNISTTLETKFKGEEITKGVAENLDIVGADSKSVVTEEIAGNETVKNKAVLTDGNREFAVKLKFDDHMYENFKKLTVSMVSDEDYPCDSAAFSLTVNEE